MILIGKLAATSTANEGSRSSRKALAKASFSVTPRFGGVAGNSKQNAA